MCRGLAGKWGGGGLLWVLAINMDNNSHERHSLKTAIPHAYGE